MEQAGGVPVQAAFQLQPELLHAVEVANTGHAVGMPPHEVVNTQPAILPQAVASAAELQSFGVPEQVSVAEQPLATLHCWAERLEQAVALPPQTNAAPAVPPEPALAPPLPPVAPPVPALLPPLPALVPPLPLPAEAPPEPPLVPSPPDVPALAMSPAWPAVSAPVSPAVALPPSPLPALSIMPPLALSSPAAFVDPAELLPALLVPAWPPELPLVAGSLELQLTPTNSTDGTNSSQPALLIV